MPAVFLFYRFHYGQFSRDWPLITMVLATVSG